MEKLGGRLLDVKEEDLILLENEPEKFWEGVTEIGRGAFYECSSLQSIKIPESVTEIEYRAFEGCSSLQSVVISNGVTKIGHHAFYACSSLQSIKIPESVTEIYEAAFYDCSSLQSIDIPDGVTKIGAWAFRNCSNLKSIEIPEGVTKIESSTFCGCSSLQSIKLPEGLTEIGQSAFESCSSLQSIDIPDDVTKIGKWAFNSCSSLQSIKLPEGVTEVGEWTFLGCSSLQSIKLPESVTEIGKEAFEGCSSLQSIKLPEGVTKIGWNTFRGCSSLQSIKLPEGLTEIGWDTFRGCSSLQSIKIPESVTKIEMGAFRGCSSLISIKLPEGVTEVGEWAFENCSSLKSIEIPEGVKKIESSTFLGCSSLQSIKLPEGLTEIGESAFENCSSLKSVKITEGVTKIEYGAFEGCSSLTTEIENVSQFGDISISVLANFKHFYLSKYGTKAVASAKKLENGAEYIEVDLNMFCKANARKNRIQAEEWKNQGKIRFIPAYAIEVFPHEQFENYFKNKNYSKWGKLLKQLGFNKLEAQQKYNTIIDLMKLYYALGGFSENQADVDDAYEYILECFKPKDQPLYNPEEVADEIHRRFSRLKIKGPYNPDFAYFFMRYYKKNPDFMRMRLENDFEEQDYLCAAHNNFSEIQKLFPNRTVRGNTKNELLSPQFVAEHCNFISYENVNEGNEALAYQIGKYGYSQEQFEQIQKIYDKAKTLKEQGYVIWADRAKSEKTISFRVLEKDDPLGFILGDLTNCCQHIGGAGEECVDDGYTNKNAGFLVFEENIKDEQGNPTGETRVLGQAYVWYDPETKTVCYDNIEIPTKILGELKKNAENVDGLRVEEFLQAVVESADAIMANMNRRGIEVERVTTGKGYNDLADEIEKSFGAPQTKNLARHRDYDGYSDAAQAQYVLRTYGDTTSVCKEEIEENLSLGKKTLAHIKKALARLTSSEKD